nr:ORF68 [Bracoviriform inaniti]
MSLKNLASASLTRELLTKETQTEKPNFLQLGCWYLNFYNQDADGDTQLHLLMVNLPLYNITTQRLIDATWPTSLLNIRNSDGMTALHLAVMNNQPGIVRYLLVGGADPMSKDNWGRIPLHFACEKNNIDLLTALTKAFEPLEIAKMQSKKLTIPNLFKSIDMRNHNGETPLFIATENGLLNVVKHLVNLGAKINTMSYRDGRRPLYIAIFKGYKDITEFILWHYHANPDKNTQFEYCYPELITPLKQMGLEKAFIRILRVPEERMYPQHSSDNYQNALAFL